MEKRQQQNSKTFPEEDSVFGLKEMSDAKQKCPMPNKTSEKTMDEFRGLGGCYEVGNWLKNFKDGKNSKL